MTRDTRPLAIAIMGPTASGKTAFAVDCALRFNTEIISVDSALVYRGLNIGLALLNKAIEICNAYGATSITLSAQVYAIPFYEKAGFIVNSDVYDDAGILHRDMILSFDS